MSDDLPVSSTQNHAGPGEDDPREVLERIDRGYRLTIKSTRGTGTRDQDKVSVEMEAETLGELVEHRDDLRGACIETMRELRAFQPDEEDDE